MTTATIEKTAAEQEHRRCIEHVNTLKMQHAQMLKRKTTVEQDIERLNRAIHKAELANEDATTLTKLRQDRATAKETIDDIRACEEAFPRELQLAEGAVHTALVVCTAEKYNRLTERQRKLESLISEATDTILHSLKMKHALAGEQRNLISGIGGIPYECAHERAIQVIIDELGKRLAALQGSPERPTSILSLDWTCRLMNRGGCLV